MSHLLQLPQELRDAIYRLVLGTRVIHFISRDIKANWTTSKEGSSSDLQSSEIVYVDDLYCHPCLEIKTEQEAYKISQDTDLNDPYGIATGVSKDRCRYCRRHSQCSLGVQKVPWPGNPYHALLKPISGQSRGRVALLGVSKTVHREASAILFASTIFSFKLAHTLTAFSRNLAPPKQSAVKILHLDINLDADNNVWSWKSDDLRSTLAPLHGLRDLHLTVRQICEGDFPAFLEGLKEGSLPLWNNDLVHFQCSSLRNVTVVVEGIDSSSLQDWNGRGGWYDRFYSLDREGHWTMFQRAEYARVLRDKLLAEPHASF